MLDFIIFFVAAIIIGWLVLVIAGALIGFFSPSPKPYVSKYKDSEDGDILD